VSATWNVNPPGAATSNFKFTQIPMTSLTRCDAMIKPGHIFLFWGKMANGDFQIVHESHTGAPVLMMTVPARYYSRFRAIRRPGW